MAANYDNIIGTGSQTTTPAKHLPEIYTTPRETLIEEAATSMFYLWGAFSVISLPISIVTLGAIDGTKIKYEGTDLEYEAVTSEGSAYLFCVGILAPLILSFLVVGIYYYMTKPDIILGQTDPGTDKERVAEKDGPKQQSEAEARRSQSSDSCFGWLGAGAKKRPDSRSMEPLVASNSHSINFSSD